MTAPRARQSSDGRGVVGVRTLVAKRGGLAADLGGAYEAQQQHNGLGQRHRQLSVLLNSLSLISLG